MGKPSAIAAVLDSDDGGGPVPPVQAKRGSNTTLSQKLNPVELQKLRSLFGQRVIALS